MKWVALFSQSGKELYHISRNIGTVPDIILTNNKDSNTWYEDLYRVPRIAIMKSKDIHNILLNKKPCIITMHGYNRILPPEITKLHQVFNGHPGDIIKYPELKGKDPQEKAFNLKLPSTGTVIHRATEELDGGDIHLFKRVDIDSKWTLNELCDHLRSASIDLWTNFMTDLLWQHKDTRGGI